MVWCTWRLQEKVSPMTRLGALAISLWMDNSVRETSPLWSPLRREDTTRHLVAAVVAFLGRQGELEGGEDRRSALQAARDALAEVYSLPGDSSLAVPRRLEDIFFRDVREEVKVERGSSAREARQGGDGGNWKRNSKEEEDEEEGKNEVKVEKQAESPSVNVEEGDEKGDDMDEDEEEEPEDLDTETDLDHALAAAEEGFTLDD